MRFIRSRKIEDARGFTLIEVIITLIVAGLLGAMLFQFMGTGVMQSTNPVIMAQNGAYLNLIMEKMSSDYAFQMAEAAKSGVSGTSALNTFIGRVGAEGTSQTLYADDISKPYTVVKNHRISFAGSPAIETSDNSSKVLRVTIKYNDLSATALFTE